MGCSTQKRNPQYWYMITSLADLSHYQVLVIAVFILNLTNLNKITFMSLKSQHTIILIELFFLNQPSKYDSKYVWIFANMNLIRCTCTCTNVHGRKYTVNYYKMHMHQKSNIAVLGCVDSNQRICSIHK